MSTGDPVCSIHGMTPCKCKPHRDEFPEEWNGRLPDDRTAAIMDLFPDRNAMEGEIGAMFADLSQMGNEVQRLKAELAEVRATLRRAEGISSVRYERILRLKQMLTTAQEESTEHEEARRTAGEGVHDLTRQMVALEADAKRYQWLRAQHNDGDGQWFVYGADSDDLDASIDAAMVGAAGLAHQRTPG